MALLLLIVAALTVLVPLLVGTLFVIQCILHGFGSLKGQPLPRRWWMTP